MEKLCELAKTDHRYTSHRFRHTLATLWRRRGMRIESISRMLGHKNLRMTMRYAAVMPPLLRQEFETAFAQIDEEHRATAQIRVLLSPEAHLAAQLEWRESLFVDLGLGWCGLTAFHPCETRLSCQSCPNLIPDKQSLPLLERQRVNLIELRGLATERLPSLRNEEVSRELTTAIGGIERNIAHLKEYKSRGKKMNREVRSEM
ncbi:MAG: tyrosine-type recombinase/integrase [Acidobacteria bacterium]|nr:tyrosine-type recombinase/integrase [Acidobacteriota bacterium]